MTRMTTEESERRGRGRKGIAIAQEILLAARPLVDGVYIMPPFAAMMWQPR